MRASSEPIATPHRSHFAPPTPMGPCTTAVLDDICGDLIQIAEVQ
jgi:hypothetical protein